MPGSAAVVNYFRKQCPRFDIRETALDIHWHSTIDSSTGIAAMGFKELILQKGWAGVTFSRPETVTRLNPVTRKHIELNNAYDYATRHLGDRHVAQRLESLQRTARADVGKLRESVLSCGGVPYMGVDLEDVALDADDAGILRHLWSLETSFLESVEAEQKENHQIRTRAILGVVHTNSLARLSYLRDLSKKPAREAE